MKEKLKSYAEIIAVVSVIFGGMSAIGMSVSGLRPAWAHEIAPLVEDLILRLKQELIEYRAKQTDYERREEAVPTWVTDKILMLEAQIVKLEQS